MIRRPLIFLYDLVYNVYLTTQISERQVIAWLIT